MSKRQDKKVGLDLLRLVMSFCVVLIHYWSDQTRPLILQPIAKITGYAVPVFMFMSFYLTQKGYLRKDVNYIKKRLWRLVWPQIGWSFVYCGIYMMLDLAFGTDKIHGISDLWWQLFTGHSPRINPAMWYQMVISLLTLIYFGIFYYFPIKTGLISIVVLMILAVNIQYSELNFILFGDLRFELKYPLGRICEMIPYATAGFLTSYFEVHKKCKKLQIPVAVVTMIFTWILMNHEFVFSPEGFGYSGVQKVLIAFGMITLAVMLPFEKLPAGVSNMITLLSKYTLAVYCMHNLIGRFMISVFIRLGLESGTFFMCVMIYIICYIIAFVISKIPIKLCGQLVE